MSKNYLELTLDTTIKDATKFMLDKQLSCVLIVGDEELLEGILTYGDIKRFLSRKSNDASNGDTSFDDVCDYWSLLIVITILAPIRLLLRKVLSAGNCFSCFLNLHAEDQLSWPRAWDINLLS